VWRYLIFSEDSPIKVEKSKQEQGGQEWRNDRRVRGGDKYLHFHMNMKKKKK
jgi:hypothetical protein